MKNLKKIMFEVITYKLKNKLFLVLLIVSFSSITRGQISGQINQNKSGLPGVDVYFENTNLKVVTDFDGNFELSTSNSNQKKDLILNGYKMKIIIKNVSLANKKYNFGNIEFPEFKRIQLNDYKNLSKLEKEDCIPMYHQNDLVGYSYTAKLNSDYIVLNCGKKIKDFEFNPKTKTITIDWKVIKNCI